MDAADLKCFVLFNVSRVQDGDINRPPGHLIFEIICDTQHHNFTADKFQLVWVSAAESSGNESLMADEMLANKGNNLGNNECNVHVLPVCQKRL